MKLFPVATGLLSHGDPSHFERVPVVRSPVGDHRVIEPWEPYLRQHQKLLELGRTPLAYRFFPDVDVDNDGTLDRIVVWKESIGRSCGADGARPSTHLLILDSEGKIDADRTSTLFRHPHGTTYAFDGRNNQPVEVKASRRYRSFGNSLGVVKFRNTFLIDTFYAPGGDLNNRRDGKENYLNTLALIRLTASRPTVMCEVVWRAH